MKSPSLLHTIYFWLKAFLRQDRVVGTVWVLAISGTIIATAASFPEIYPDQASIAARAALMDNPSAIIMSGPSYLISKTSLGAMLTHEMLLYAAIAVAVMSITLTIKHTRRDEEEGRTELFTSYAAHKTANVVAAFVEVGMLNLLTGILIAIGIGSLGIQTMSWEGSWLFGFAIAAFGLNFSAIAVLAAQLAQQPRSAISLALAVLGLSFMIRAVGDVSLQDLSWLSPFGWSHATQAFTDDQWWPLLLNVTVSLFVATLAIKIAQRRDIGEGLLRAKPGPATAKPWLNNVLAMTAKLQTATIITWAASGFIFGAVYGSLAPEVQGFMDELDLFLLPETDQIMDVFLVTVISVYAVTALVLAMTSLGRLKSEEQSGRTEVILSTPTSMTSWVTSHILVALAATIIFLLSSSLGTGLSAAYALNDWAIVSTLLEASLAYIPALLVIISLATILYGLGSRFVDLTWVAIGFIVIVWMTGFFLQLPDWISNLSPIEHVPMLPIEDLHITNLSMMTAISLTLIISGLWLAHRRDING